MHFREIYKNSRTYLSIYIANLIIITYYSMVVYLRINRYQYINVTGVILWQNTY